MIEDQDQESHEESGDPTQAEKSLPQEAVEGYISIKEYGDTISDIIHSDDPPAHDASGDDTSADPGDDSGADDSGAYENENPKGPF